MTPAEEFAAKRTEAESLIRQHAPERLQEQLIALLRPAIVLTATRADDAQIPVGTSKFGGAPDVPGDFVWPMWNDKPLGFLAQINLEEVAPFDVDGLLPKSGLLSFFLGKLDYDWCYGPEDVGGWRVFYFPHFKDRQESRTEISSTATISFNAKSTLSNLLLFESVIPQISVDEALILSEHLAPLRYNPPFISHQMFGNAQAVGGSEDPLRLAAQGSKIRAPEDFVLLLQVDSDEQFNFDYCCGGTVFFMISIADLQNRNFHRVWFEGQS